MPSQQQQLVAKASIAISDVATDRTAEPAEIRKSLRTLQREIENHLDGLPEDDED